MNPFRLKLLILCATGAAGAGWGWTAFGPHTGRTVSFETTFILEPLAEDGLPNYALALFHDSRDSKRPSDNAAVLLWQAVGPVMMSDDEFALLCREINVNPVAAERTLESPFGDEMRDKLGDWIDARRAAKGLGPLGVTDESDEVAESEIVDETVRQLLIDMRSTSWRAEDCPPLAQWIAENQGPLDLLVAAAARPEFFSPSPDLIRNSHTPLYDVLIPHGNALSIAGRSLLLRAARRISARDYPGAWRDCVAGWQLGEHLAQAPVFVERLVSVALRGACCRTTIALLQAPDVPPELAQQIHVELEEFSPGVSMAECFDDAERGQCLDGVLRLMTGRLGGVGEGFYEYYELRPAFGTLVARWAYDLDISLKAANQWFDKIGAAAAIGDVHARRRAADVINEEISAFTSEFKTAFPRTWYSRSRRSEMAGSSLATLFIPDFSAGFAAENRDEVNKMLVRLAAALAVHRIRNGEYPDALQELTPQTLPQLPRDPFSGEPPRYERRGDGYLLYSVLENGIDDGGDDFTGEIIDGEWVLDGEPVDIDYFESSDLVIRVPRPPLRLPFNEESP